MDNIKEFEIMFAKVLNDTYSSFPTPIEIHINEETIAERKDREKLAGTIRYMADEGLIMCKDDGGRYGFKWDFYNLTLTSKGLATLDYLPPNSSNGKSYIEEIKDYFRDISGGATKDLGKSAIVDLIRSFISNVSSFENAHSSQLLRYLWI